MSQLPVELYRNIFRFIQNNSDMRMICAVSRTAKREAEPILFHTVAFTGSDHNRIVSWATRIESSAHIARMVHSLMLPEMCTIPSDSQVDFFLLLAGAFRKVVNLKALFIARQSCNLPPGTPVVHAWMLKGCQFQLHTFFGRPRGFKPIDLWWFFYEQPEIREWTTGRHPFGNAAFLPNGILPRLSVVNMTPTNGEEALNMLKNLARRPIERLSFRSDPIMPLHQFGSPTLFQPFELTLTHLSLEASGAFSPQPVDTIVEVTAQLPRLKFFSWFSYHFRKISFDDQKRLQDAMSMLAELESLLLEVNFETVHGDPHIRHPPVTAAKTLEMANAFASSCPTLCRIAFAIPAHDPHSHPVEPRFYPCYVRTTSGGLALKGNGILNKSSWREI